MLRYRLCVASPSATLQLGAIVGRENLEQGVLERLLRGGDGHFDMFAQQFRAVLGIALDGGLDDGRMGGDLCLVMRRMFDLDAADEADARIDGAELADKFGISGEFGDEQMEAFVLGQDDIRRLVRVGVDDRFPVAPQPVDFAVVGALAHQFESSALDDRAELVEIEQALGAEASDEKASIGGERNETLGGEPVQRLADRCARNAEAARKLDLVDALSGLQLEFDQELADGVVGAFAAIGCAARLRFSGKGRVAIGTGLGSFGHDGSHLICMQAVSTLCRAPFFPNFV